MIDAMPGKGYRRHHGFSMIELIMVMVVLSILAVTVGTRWDAASSTIPYQAEVLARNIRHAQILAMNWGQTLRFTIVSPTNYTVNCPPGGPNPPCNGVGPIMDPSTDSGTFSATLTNTVTIAGPATLDIDRFGRPVNPATGALTTAPTVYTLSTGALTVSARVQPITGFVTITSP